MALDALAEPTIVAPGPAPPEDHLTPRQWVKANLFSSPFNTVLTVIFGVIAAWAIYQIIHWITVTADWKIVEVFLRRFMVGNFPVDQLWRLWASLYVVIATVGFVLGAMTRLALRRNEAAARRDDEDENQDRVEADPAPTEPQPVVRYALEMLHRFWPAVLALVVVLSFTRTIWPTVLAIGMVAILLVARWIGLHVALGGGWLWLVAVGSIVLAVQLITFGPSGVGWDDWGGLQLTVFATVAGITLAFPFGLVLALGRRSSLPAIRMVCIGFIELFRAVPLVTLLFMGNYMIGFFIPTWASAPGKLTRAIIAITLFSAAYIAEIVRGGIQSVPRGQIEAAQAVGLPPTRVLRFVVLPQALRAVVPAMVGQFISLFKDTSLLAILAFPDLLRVADQAPQADGFRGQGLLTVTLAFVGLIYWAGSITMSRESRRLEQRLGVGER
jgi:general L-amino acid transport system permease protein